MSVKMIKSGKIYENLRDLHVFSDEDINNIKDFKPEFEELLIEFGLAEYYTPEVEIETPEVDISNTKSSKNKTRNKRK